MELAFGADFGAVRVHAGPEASELNQRIQATAFTTGNDIYFRDGMPDTSSSSGQELLAHELTHTIQQSTSIGRRIQRSVATFGGTFSPVQYEAVSGKPAGGKQTVGAVIDLEFVPNDLVEGEVGLVQTGNAKRNGAVDIAKNDAGKQARAQKAGDLDEGRFLDRSNRKENPVFGMENAKSELSPIDEAEGISLVTDAGGKPSDQRNRDAKEVGATVTKADPSAAIDAAKVSEQAGTIGGRDSKGGVRAAKLRDEPGRHRVWDPTTSTGETVEMRFESAALGLSGGVQGAYLGSIEWGFMAPGDQATAQPLPFRLISRGVPSEAFMASAKLWNDNGNIDMGGGTRRLALPLALTTHRTDPALDALLDDPATSPTTLRTALDARIAKLRSEIPADIGERLAVLGTTSIEDREAADVFQRALDALNDQWRDLKDQIQTAYSKKLAARVDLQQAQDKLQQVDAALNAFTRRIGDGKKRLKSAKNDAAAKQRAVDDAAQEESQASASQDALGPKINSARQDAGFRTALVTYRDSLMALQDTLSDARSRQLEIDALTAERSKLDALAVATTTT